MGMTGLDLLKTEQIARRGSLDGHVKIKAKTLNAEPLMFSDVVKQFEASVAPMGVEPVAVLL